MSAQPSRIEAARQRATGVKQVAAAGAVAGFLAVLLLAKASHPGTHASSSTSSGRAQSTSEESDDDGSFGFGSSSVSPSGGTQPQAQTGVS
jgi:hypothetical protein